MKSLRTLQGLALALMFFFASSSPLQASEWAKEKGYGAQTWGKFKFGLKYVTLGWTTAWLEANEPEYKREWEGFCTGIGKGFVFEGVGLIHLVTFFIPADVPDVGIGMHLPNKNCPMRHDPKWHPVQEESKKDLTKVPEPKKKTQAAPLIVEPKASAPALPLEAEETILAETKPAVENPPSEEISSDEAMEAQLAAAQKS